MTTAEQKYQPRYYGVLVTIPADPKTGLLPAGRSNENSFNVTDVPFIIKRISTQMVGINGLVDSSIQPPPVMSQWFDTQDDGQYSLEWRTARHNYQNQPISVKAGYGSPEDHPDIPSPDRLRPQDTVVCKITNHVQRYSALVVQVVFAGSEPTEGRATEK